MIKFTVSDSGKISSTRSMLSLGASSDELKWKQAEKVCVCKLICNQRLLPLTVPRLHRYEWNSNWVRNVQWANGSAMLPGWPALFSLPERVGCFPPLTSVYLKSVHVCVCSRDISMFDTGSDLRLCCVYKWLLCLPVFVIFFLSLSIALSNMADLSKSNT